MPPLLTVHFDSHLLTHMHITSTADGEVESFELWPLARVAETIRTTEEYKPNVALVIIDFLIRCG